MDLFERPPEASHAAPGVPQADGRARRDVLGFPPLRPADEGALLECFSRLTPEDRQALRANAIRPEAVRAGCREMEYRHGLPILAGTDGRIIGDATRNRRPSGWMRHAGEIRVGTDPLFGGAASPRRRRGRSSIFTVQGGLDG